MTRFRTCLLVTAVLAASSLFAGGVSKSADADDDQQAVRAALSDFHVALNRLFTGDAGPMSDVWSHADDVSYMGPDGGFQVGWSEIRAEWDRQAAKKLGGKIRPEKVHVLVGANIAVTQNYEVGENNNTGQGAQQVRIRATNIFRKENGKWKLVSHHTDELPFLKN